MASRPFLCSSPLVTGEHWISEPNLDSKCSLELVIYIIYVSLVNCSFTLGAIVSVVWATGLVHSQTAASLKKKHIRSLICCLFFMSSACCVSADAIDTFFVVFLFLTHRRVACITATDSPYHTAGDVKLCRFVWGSWATFIEKSWFKCCQTITFSEL